MKRNLFVAISVALLSGIALAEAFAAEKSDQNLASGSSQFRGDPAAVMPDLNQTRQTVIDSIPAPGTWHMGLAWDGNYLWNVSNALTPKVAYKIDPQTGTVVDIVTTAIYGNVLGCTYLHGSLWIQEYQVEGRTYEINPVTGAVISSFPSPAGYNSRGLTNDGVYLWIMDASAKVAYQVTTAGTLVRSVSMPMVDWAMDAAWNWQRGTLFLCDDEDENNIKEIDVSGATAILLDEFTHPGAASTPEGITYDGRYLWTTAFTASWIWQIDIGDPGPAVLWDFETGLQGWTHTNGQPFPAGWAVQSSNLHATQTLPSAGDSSMWIDSDAAGAGTHVADSALSSVLVPAADMDWLKYGICNWHYGGTQYVNEVHVGLKYYTSSAWNTVELKVYPTSGAFGPAWDSVDVSTYATADYVQIYFYFDDLNTWGYWAVFDNVWIKASVATHDVGCDVIVSPPSGDVIRPDSYPVIGQIKNFGNYDETFDVQAEVWDTTTWTQVFNQTTTLTNFPVGAESLINFGVVAFAMSKVYRTLIYTLLVGDEDPANDTNEIHSMTIPFNQVWDFETGLQGWTHTNGLAFPAGWAVMPSGYKPYVPPNAGDSTMWIDSDQAGSVTLWDTAYSPAVVLSPSTNLMKYGIGFRWYVYGNAEYVTVGVKPFTGGAWQAAVGLQTYNANFPPAWDSVDLSAYQGADSIRVFFSYNNANYDWYAGFDNVMLSAQTGITEDRGDVRVVTFGFSPKMATLASGQVGITYLTTTPGHVSLSIYDIMGRRVKDLINGPEPAGQKSLVWNRIDDQGRTVAAGVYLLKLEVDGQTAFQKVILIK